MYEVRFLDAASRDLGRLDSVLARRLLARIRWLATNFEQIQPEALAGNLAGLYKLRMGDYRAVYEILHEEQTLVIHFVGHRRDVYRRR